MVKVYKLYYRGKKVGSLYLKKKNGRVYIHLFLNTMLAKTASNGAIYLFFELRKAKTGKAKTKKAKKTKKANGKSKKANDEGEDINVPDEV